MRCESVKRRPQSSFSPIPVPGSKEDRDQCKNEYGGVEISQEKRFCIGLIGEDCLRRVRICSQSVYSLGVGIHSQESLKLSIRRQQTAGESDPKCAVQHPQQPTLADLPHLHPSRKALHSLRTILNPVTPNGLTILDVEDSGSFRYRQPLIEDSSFLSTISRRLN